MRGSCKGEEEEGVAHLNSRDDAAAAALVVVGGFECIDDEKLNCSCHMAVRICD